MRNVCFFLLFVFGVSYSPVSRAADDKPAESNLQVKVTPAEIEKLVQQLGSDEFADREAAVARLKKLSTLGAEAGELTKAALQKALNSQDREVVGRAKALLAEMQKAHENRGVVCVVGLYESRNGPAIVEVNDSGQPIILVVCAYEPVTWQIKPAKGVEIVRVIASGYHAQTVEGTEAPVLKLSYDEMSTGPDGKLLYFYTYDHDEDSYPKMVAAVHALTGKKPKWFQGRYGFRQAPFVIAAPE